jgi:hypothetical protein
MPPQLWSVARLPLTIGHVVQRDSFQTAGFRLISQSESVTDAPRQLPQEDRSDATTTVGRKYGKSTDFVHRPHTRQPERANTPGYGRGCYVSWSGPARSLHLPVGRQRWPSGWPRSDPPRVTRARGAFTKNRPHRDNSRPPRRPGAEVNPAPTRSRVEPPLSGIGCGSVCKPVSKHARRHRLHDPREQPPRLQEAPW